MSNLVQQEELKRDRHWDARERWRLILEAITWAEAQSTVRRNTPQRCLAEQARKLASCDIPPARQRRFNQELRKSGMDEGSLALSS